MRYRPYATNGRRGSPDDLPAGDRKGPSRSFLRRILLILPAVYFAALFPKHMREWLVEIVDLPDGWRLPGAFLACAVLAAAGTLAFLLFRGQEKNRQPSGRTAAAVLLAAAAVRIPLLFLFRAEPFSDYAYYLRLARSFAETGVMETEPYLVAVASNAVFYAAFLGGLFSMFGASTQTALFSALILDALSSLLIYKIGEKLFSRRSALISAVFYALNPTAVLFGFMPATEHLAIPLCLAGMYGALLSLKPDRKGGAVRAALAGGALGLSCAVRAGALFTLLAICACAAAGLVRARREERKIPALRAGCLLAGFLLASFACGLLGTSLLGGQRGQTPYGWTLFEGMDAQTAGGWDAAHSEVLFDTLDRYPIDQVQPVLLGKAMERVSAYTVRDWAAMFAAKGLNVWIREDVGGSVLGVLSSDVFPSVLTRSRDISRLCSLIHWIALWALIVSMLFRGFRGSAAGERGTALALIAIQILLMILWHSFATSIPRYHLALTPLTALMVPLCARDTSGAGQDIAGRRFSLSGAEQHPGSGRV